jgi:hypothetical protein
LFHMPTEIRVLGIELDQEFVCFNMFHANSTCPDGDCSMYLEITDDVTS